MDTGDRDREGIERLRRENAFLLDQLEIAYQNLEEILSTADHETQIVYRELRKKNQELEQRLAEIEDANSQLRRAEEQLKKSLQEKEVLLKEVYHRVKNNFQVISSLLNLQARYFTDEQILDAFHACRHRVDSMGLVHEWLYQSDDLAQIDFAEYVRILTRELLDSYGADEYGIGLRLGLEEILLRINTAIPCGLIINELVSNALKHAFPSRRGGEIHVQMASDGTEFILTVGDNGCGFPEDLDFRKTQTMGLLLVNTLVQQLNGTIELNREEGTTFEINFPDNRLSGDLG